MFVIVKADDGRLYVNLKDFYDNISAPINYKAFTKTLLGKRVEGKDYKRLSDDNYLITVDLARQTAVLFCENEVVKALDEELKTPDVLNTQLEAANKEIERLKAKIAEDAPKVLFCNAVAAAEGSISLTALNALLMSNGVYIGVHKLTQLLREQGYLSGKGVSTMPTQRAVEMGLFEVCQSYYNGGKGVLCAVPHTVVTQKGVAYFINHFLRYANDKPVPIICDSDEQAQN